MNRIYAEAVQRLLVVLDFPERDKILDTFIRAYKGDADCVDHLKSWNIGLERAAPSDYQEIRDKYIAYQLVSTFPYYPSMSDEEKELAAYRKFKEGEETCRNTNIAIKRRLFSDEFYRYADKAARIVAKVLGEPPRPEEIPLRFGNGAVAEVPRSKATIENKVKVAQCSIEAHDVLQETLTYTALQDAWAFNLQVVEHACIVIYVNKNAYTFRQIAVPVSGDSVLQLAVGDILTKRVRRVGIYIRDDYDKIIINPDQPIVCVRERHSPSEHGTLAREGSWWNNYSTYDFSNASNLWAIMAVMLSLKYAHPEWVRYLKACFPRTYTVKSDYVEDAGKLQMAATMGNGVIFPLQSLLFYAWTKAIGFSDVSVYGDDLIVNADREKEQTMRWLFGQLGHKLNVDKSYFTGFFRESCGSDWFNGMPMPRIKLKETGNTAFGAISLHNRIFEAFYDDESDTLDPRVIPTLMKIRKAYPCVSWSHTVINNGKKRRLKKSALIPGVPLYAGDVGYAFERKHVRYKYLRDLQCQGFDVLKPRYRTLRSDPSGSKELLVGALLGQSSVRTTSRLVSCRIATRPALPGKA